MTLLHRSDPKHAEYEIRSGQEASQFVGWRLFTLLAMAAQADSTASR